LAPRNIDVNEINSVILESLYKELHTYLNVDSLVLTEEGANVCCRSFNGFIISGGIFEHFAI
jgi:hypothetical protein